MGRSRVGNSFCSGSYKLPSTLTLNSINSGVSRETTMTSIHPRSGSILLPQPRGFIYKTPHPHPHQWKTLSRFGIITEERKFNFTDKIHNRSVKMESITGANLGFEREIFAAADKLRGNVDAAEYKMWFLD